MKFCHGSGGKGQVVSGRECGAEIKHCRHEEELQRLGGGGQLLVNTRSRCLTALCVAENRQTEKSKMMLVKTG